MEQFKLDTAEEKRAFLAGHVIRQDRLFEATEQERVALRNLVYLMRDGLKLAVEALDGAGELPGHLAALVAEADKILDE